MMLAGEYCSNALSAKVARTIFNDTEWVKILLLLALNLTGSNVVIKIIKYIGISNDAEMQWTFLRGFFHNFASLLLEISNICRCNFNLM